MIASSFFYLFIQPFLLSCSYILRPFYPKVEGWIELDIENDYMSVSPQEVDRHKQIWNNFK